jgi:membrane protease YdiL (CAAX protease family)
VVTRHPALRDLWHDRRWWAALAAGPLVAVWLASTWPSRSAASLAVAGWIAVVALQPLAEELFFRGILQGQLVSTTWGSRQWAGFTVANLLVSVTFAVAHLWHHPAAWAAGVLVPSLLFGYFRDRHGSVVTPVILHGAYNAAYFIANSVLGRG